ncbi:unnamed protein product [Arabidopsis thaliana]|uniref:Uncharacterized protein n=2 Tax=Arabidopsis thaliana TaxID=3702 RepID=A0A654F9V9_ARATH|nr:uncharacterized protein AT2G35935 [Arabidopsis thaliana]ANM62480.1 hypothetical protein AT2G35935 [Arabidopsis thaliana]CAA0374917.1 unnamed protein product [Arabidopsis thaliana]VYS54591.1 unnamed protein product [Arabidopsis thaliana]|eukprot:NP_001324636.1 hypothetical protein AT2G35935 [Arabidopsis thaliana]
MRSSMITEITPASTALCLFLPHGHMFTNICMAALVAFCEIRSSKIWTTSVKTSGLRVILCIGSATSRMFLRSKVIPVETITGSFMISKEIGQRKNGGISISSSIIPPDI